VIVWRKDGRLSEKFIAVLFFMTKHSYKCTHVLLGIWCL